MRCLVIRFAISLGYRVGALGVEWLSTTPTTTKEWRAGAISRADVADCLVRQVDDRALIGTTPLLIN
jgi:hypothetical protein